MLIISSYSSCYLLFRVITFITYNYNNNILFSQTTSFITNDLLSSLYEILVCFFCFFDV